MIVLDEQLLGRGLEVSIAAWYPGAVLLITDLRPNSVIKDEAIPTLLRQQNQPSFVTINAIDFWQRVAIHTHFCLLGFTLPDSRVPEVGPKLRAIFQQPGFDTKAKRVTTRIMTANGFGWW